MMAMQKVLPVVIPAQAGIHNYLKTCGLWIRHAGLDPVLK